MYLFLKLMSVEDMENAIKTRCYFCWREL